MVVPAWWCMDVCVILGVCVCMCVCVVFVFFVFLSVMLVQLVLLHFMRNKLYKNCCLFWYFLFSNTEYFSSKVLGAKLQ